MTMLTIQEIKEDISAALVNGKRAWQAARLMCRCVILLCHWQRCLISSPSSNTATISCNWQCRRRTRHSVNESSGFLKTSSARACAG